VSGRTLEVALERLRELAEYTRELETQLDGDDAGEGPQLIAANGFIAEHEPPADDAETALYQLTHRVLSESMGVMVGLWRYRVVRDAIARDVLVEPDLADYRWTLWHDEGRGSSHTVGATSAYETLDDALEAAVGHRHP
jgi:hypothetical protein